MSHWEKKKLAATSLDVVEKTITNWFPNLKCLRNTEAHNFAGESDGRKHALVIRGCGPVWSYGGANDGQPTYDVAVDAGRDGRLEFNTDWYAGVVAGHLGEGYGTFMQRYGFEVARGQAEQDGKLWWKVDSKESAAQASLELESLGAPGIEWSNELEGHVLCISQNW